MAGVGFLQRLRKNDLGGLLAPLGSDGWCVFPHSVHGVECARKVQAPHGELFFIF